MENDHQPERAGGSQPPASTSRNKLLLLLVAVAVLLLLAVFFYLRGPAEQPEPVSLAPPEPRETVTAPEPVAPPAPPPAPVKEPEVEIPPPAPKPLPPLNESDTTVRDALGELGEGQGLLGLLVPDELIRKFVRATHVLASEGVVVHEYRPINSPSGSIVVEKTEEIADEEINQHYRLLEDNYRRYDPYVSLLARLEPDALMAVYRRFLPLLEQAYAEQGVDNGGFTQVMIGAIDHILATPVHNDELILVRPRVFYQYEDPSMERLPGGHKLMLRMGPQNAQSVKASLSRFRTRLEAL